MDAALALESGFSTAHVESSEMNMPEFLIIHRTRRLATQRTQCLRYYRPKTPDARADVDASLATLESRRKPANKSSL